MPWQFVSIIAMACFATAILLFRVIGNQVTPVALLVHLFGIGFIAYLAQAGLSGLSLSLPWRSWSLVALAAGACWLGNICQVRAVTAASNPGQALAIINSSVVLVALLAVPLFGANLDWPRCVGIGLCLAGILLICLMP